MTSKTSQHDPTAAHGEVWELLPWYVNRTLDEPETALVETHLRECVTCRRELAELQDHQNVLRQSAWQEEGLEHSLASMNTQLDRENAPATQPHGNGLGDFWQRLKENWFGSPGGMRLVMGGQAVAIAAALVWIGTDQRQPEEQIFVTLSDAAGVSSPQLYRVKVADQLAEAQLRGLLIETEMDIVSGPTPTGVYTLRPRQGDSDMDTLIERLETSPAIEVALPVSVANP
ncbi:MAG: zf-HC2 domain-containing protein [Pseudomonadota bacterium]